MSSVASTWQSLQKGKFHADYVATLWGGGVLSRPCPRFLWLVARLIQGKSNEQNGERGVLAIPTFWPFTIFI